MRIWLAVAATATFAHASAAFAQEQSEGEGEARHRPASELLQPPKKHQVASPITDRFALRVTYFSPTVDTFLRLDRTTGQAGTELIVEEDLGLEDKPQQARAEMIIRLREKNRLRVDYFKLTRYGNQVLDTTINFGDETFVVNERVESMIDWRQLGLTYTRSVLYFDRFELGAGLGIALLETRARGKVQRTTGAVEESEDGIAPFPTFALDATWRISKRWSFNIRGQTFTANTDDFDATLSDYHGDIQYRWRKNFTVGLGYTMLRIDAESLSTEDMRGRFKQDIDGPEFFIRASF
jgi:hypothetical protein